MTNQNIYEQLASIDIEALNKSLLKDDFESLEENEKEFWMNEFKKAQQELRQTDIISEIIAENQARKFHKTSINIFETDYQKAGQIAKKLNMTTQEFLREIIHKSLKSI